MRKIHKTNSDEQGVRKEHPEPVRSWSLPSFGRSGTPGSRAWRVYLILGVLVVCGYLLIPYPTVQGAIFIALGTSAVIAIVVGIEVHRPPHPLVWYLLATVLLMFVAGDLTYGFYGSVPGAVTTPSLADAFYLGSYPLIAAGLLDLARRRTPRAAWTIFVDAMILAIGLGMLSWVFLMTAHTAQTPSTSLLERLLLVAYPLTDVLLLAVMVRFIMTPGTRTPTYYLFILALVLTLISDASYSVVSLAGTFEGGGLIDVGWLLAYLLWGTAALHPSMITLSEPIPEREPKLWRTRLVVLASVLLVAPAILTIQVARGEQVDVPVIVGGSAVLFLLVLIRMEGLLRTLSTTLARYKRTEEALRESEERFRQLFENSVDTLFVHDEEGRILDCNSQACRSLGYTREELLALRVGDLFSEEEQRTKKGDTLWERVVHNKPRPTMDFVQNELRRKDGTTFPVEVGVGAIDYGGQRLILASARDITERKTLEKRLAHQAFHDSLTKLPNRTLFMDRLEHVLSRAKRQEDRVAVLFTDLDDFKTANDSLGHEVGDRLLVKVAERLSRHLRPGDTAARFGGDEFTILLEDIEDVNEATQVAKRISDALQAPFVVEGQELFVTISIGVALSSSAEDQSGSLLRNADLAMYQAKAKGKNQHAVFDPGMNARALKRLGLEGDLRRAIERKEFRVYYQPEVLLDDNLQQRLKPAENPAIVTPVTDAPRVIGMEALVRWEHSERGPIPATEFIPIAEESGLIIPIGYWVLREACRQTKQWHEQYPSDSPLMISVNLSAKQFNHPDLVGTIAEVLQEVNLESQTLTLEIAESAVMEDADTTIDILTRLKNLGVKIAIDDFGTGYSSLFHLKCFPVNFLKIDRFLVGSLEEEPEDKGLMSAVLNLAHTLDLKTIAERVETEEQLVRLRELRCEMAQGYYFWEPVSREAASELLMAHSRRHPVGGAGV